MRALGNVAGRVRVVKNEGPPSLQYFYGAASLRKFHVPRFENTAANLTKGVEICSVIGALRAARK